MDALGFDSRRAAALAVSGGGDSVALMMLFAAWARAKRAPAPCVLIVDHGLREGSRREAKRVAEWAAAEGLDASVLSSGEPAPKANVEDWARALRYRLMGEWCRAQGVNALFVAHTRDEQAETFLLRLGRGSGVDGLSAMRARGSFPLREFHDLALYRPLLGFARAELRRELANRGIAWLEDPMNADTRFARARIRALMPLLEEAGIGSERIADAARHLSRAREALEAETARFLGRSAHFAPEGFALLDGAALKAAEPEIGLRALAAVLMRVSGEDYRPRFERLERLLAAIGSGPFAARTLHFCRIGQAPKARRQFGPATLVIGREPPRRRGQKASSASERA